MQRRNIKFVKDSLPIIEHLSRQWVPIGLKTNEGYSIGCGYCDMRCNGSAHDGDCIAQMAKDVMSKIEEILNDSRYETDQQGNIRPAKDIEDMRYYWIKKHLLNDFYKYLMSELIPLDYGDPDNKSTVCSMCYRNKYGGGTNKNAHSKNCLKLRLAKNLSELYQP